MVDICHIGAGVPTQMIISFKFRIDGVFIVVKVWLSRLCGSLIIMTRFDKAVNVYKKILNEDSSDAETDWPLVLCLYGIEYVEDPATHKHVPTVNRAQFASIYEDEAKAIQKDICIICMWKFS